MGVRDPLGLMIHPETGEFWEVEHGPQGGDEVNIVRAGRNYGWPVISYGQAYTGEKTQGPGGSGPELAEPCAPGMEQPFLFWSPVVSPGSDWRELVRTTREYRWWQPGHEHLRRTPHSLVP